LAGNTVVKFCVIAFGLLGLHVVLLQRNRDGREPFLGDDIACERRAAIGRVLDHHRGLAEITREHLLRHDGVVGRQRLPLIAQPLIGAHEEGLVAAVVELRNDHRAIQFEPILVLAESGFSGGRGQEEAASVKRVVADELDKFPWSALLPLFVTMLRCTPRYAPYCAEYVPVCTSTS
jgi:hypothetical protein